MPSPHVLTSPKAALVLLAALGLLLRGAPFTLAAFNAASSSPGNTFTVLVVQPAMLSPSTSLAAGVVRLVWSASPTAATESVTYGILRRPSGSGPYVQIATTSALTYDDTPAADGLYDHAIRTIVTTLSSDSNAQTARSDRTPPTLPVVAALTGTATGTVDLTWIASSDAGSGLQGYTIRYVQAAACPAASPPAYPSTLSVGTVTSTTVGGLGSNKKYCFYFVATDNVGNASGPSNVASAKAK